MRIETDHPEPAELLAVYLGTLDSTERDPIEEHLSRCPECAQAVLDFGAFPELSPIEEDRHDAALRRRLDEQKRRLVEMSREERVEPREEMPSRAMAPVGRLGREAPSRSRNLPWIASPVVAWAVAAMFLVATVGMGLWREGASLGPVWTMAPVLEGLVVSQRSLGDEPMKVVLAGDGTVIRLKLQAYAQEFSDYRVLLIDRSGDEVSSTPVPELHQGDSLLVNVPHSIVSPGVYRFEVHAVGPSGVDSPVGVLPVEFAEPELGAPRE